MKNLLIIILVFCAGIISAQKQNNNWINGNRLWNFNNTSSGDFADTSISTGYNTFKQSVSNISDRNTGSLLFYTNSFNIYDKNNNIMDNGNGANLFGNGDNLPNYGLFSYYASIYGGNNAAQGSLIIPDPGNSNRYYVFSLIGNTPFSGYSSNSQIYKYGLRYAVVDMSDGLGKVISKNNVLFSNTNTDVMTSCASTDGGYWLVTQNDAGKFLSYKITTTGISLPVVSSQVYSLASDGLKISPNRQYLFDIGSRNLYYFNSNSGTISLYRNIINGNTGSLSFYSSNTPGSAEFSEDSNIIYFTAIYETLGTDDATKKSSQSYYLGKYNISNNFLTGYNANTGSYLRSIGPSSFQRQTNGIIYLKTYSKTKNYTWGYYTYDDSSTSIYKIINSNSTANNFDNIILYNNTSNTGYTLPQLVEYPPECTNTLNITQNVTSNGNYKASNQIIASSIINPNLIVNYAAGNQISLLPGFQVNGNSTGIFRAYLQECNPYGLVPETANRNSSKSPKVLENGNNLKIYPNPVSYILTIENGKEKVISWQLYDVSGKLMKNGNSNTVDVQSIPNASYVLKINLEKTQISKTIIVKH